MSLARFDPQVEASGHFGQWRSGPICRLWPAGSGRRRASHGPLSGILSALIWAAPRGATAVVSVPVDGPFLPPDLVPRLCLAAEAVRPRPCRQPRLAGTRPMACGPSPLPRPLPPSSPRAPRPASATLPLPTTSSIADFPDDLAFANANTPEDIARFAGPDRGGHMKVYGIIGWKNSGKTSLMERLVAGNHGQGADRLDRQACPPRRRS